MNNYAWWHTYFMTFIKSQNNEDLIYSPLTFFCLFSLRIFLMKIIFLRGNYNSSNLMLIQIPSIFSVHEYLKFSLKKRILLLHFERLMDYISLYFNKIHLKSEVYLRNWIILIFSYICSTSPLDEKSKSL